MSDDADDTSSESLERPILLRAVQMKKKPDAYASKRRKGNETKPTTLLQQREKGVAQIIIAPRASSRRNIYMFLRLCDFGMIMV